MATNGVFNIDDWQVIAKPDSNVTISLWTAAIDLYDEAKANDGFSSID